jgi:hypothetical protein
VVNFYTEPCKNDKSLTQVVVVKPTPSASYQTIFGP